MGGISLLASLLCFKILSTNLTIIRHSTLHDLAKIFVAVGVKSMSVTLVAELLFEGFAAVPIIGLYLLFVDLIFTFGLLIVVRVLMLWVYDFLKKSLSYNSHAQNVLVYGRDEKSASLALRFKTSSHYRIKGFISYAKKPKTFTLQN